MKRSVMKRCIAMLLVAAMVFTSVNTNWSLTSKAADLLTDADLVASNYELTDEEVELLTSYVSAQVRGDNESHPAITTPPEDNADSVVVVDSVAKVIYAKNYKTLDGNYTWVPISAKVVGENDTEEVTLSPGSVEYRDQSYDASSAFEFDENGYQVQVEYALYIDVEESKQTAMFDALDKMEKLYTYAEIIKNSGTAIDSIAQVIPKILEQQVELDDIENELAAIQEQIDNNGGKCDLTTLCKAASGSNLKHILDNYESIDADKLTYKKAIAEAYEIAAAVVKSADDEENGDLNYLLWFLSLQGESTQATIDLINEFVDIFRILQSDLEALVAEGAWKGLDNTLVDGTADFSKFDALVESLVDVESRTYENETLLAGTATVYCNVNSYDVIFVFVANVYAGTQKLTEVKEYKVNFPDGSIEKVQAKLNEYEALAIDSWKENYNVKEGDFYSRDAKELAKLIPEGLTKNMEYKVTYDALPCVVNISGSGGSEKIEAYYGQTITLPTTAAAGKSYTYTISDGTEPVLEGVLEGTVYRVLGKEVSAVRTIGAKKTDVRLYPVAGKQYEQYLNEKAIAIMNSKSVLCDSYIVTSPTEDGITIEGQKLTVSPQNAFKAEVGGNQKQLQWLSPTAYVYKADGSLTQTIEANAFVEEGNNYVATITAADYQRVEVFYNLTFENVDTGKVLEALNVAVDLAEDAKEHFAGMNMLVDYKDSLSMVSPFTIGVLKNKAQELGCSAATLAAINSLISCCDSDGLYLVAYAEGYLGDNNSNNDVEKLEYYYRYNKEISEQVGLLYGSLNVMLNDPKMEDLLEEMGYLSKLDRVLELVEELKDKLVPAEKAESTVDGRIIHFGPEYNALLAAIVDAIDDVPRFDANTVPGTTLEMQSEAVVIPAEHIVKVTVTVNGESKAFFAEKNVAFGTDFVKELEDAAADMGSEYATSGLYQCELQVVNDNGISLNDNEHPDANFSTKENLSITYTWVPKEFKVHVKDNTTNETIEDVAVVTNDNKTFILPAPQDSDIRYDYTYGSQSESVEFGEQKTFTFKSLPSTGDTITVQRTSVNAYNEKVLNLVKALNNALISIGEQDTITFLAYEDANHNMSVVMRVGTPDTATISSVLEKLVTTIVLESGISYLGFGGTDAKPGEVQGFLADGSIHIDAFVNALLDSNFSLDNLNAAINANGSINNTDKVKGNLLQCADDQSKLISPQMKGGLLMEMTVALQKGKATPLYVTLQDFGAYSDYLAKLDKALNKSDAYVDLELVDGAVNVDLTVPEKAHEAYLAAMLAEGKIDVKNFRTPTLVEMVEYADELAVEPLIKSGEVDGVTILNTIAELGIERDASEYEALMTKVLSYTKKALDQGYVTELNVEGQAANLYKGQIACPESKIQSVIGSYAGSTDIASMIKGDVVIPMNTTLTNCDTKYTAAVLDLDREEIYNKVDLTTAKKITTTNANTVVVLVGEVDQVTVKGNTYLNLNGQKVGSITTEGDATVTVVDSRLATEAGYVGAISGNATVLGGTYGHMLDNGMLPDGYVQDKDSKTVSNRYYTIVEDEEGNITIQVSADFMEIEEGTAWKKLALDMAVDVVFDAYSWAGVTVTNNDTKAVFDLYEVAIEDAIKVYKNGVRPLAETIINENLNKGQGFVAFANDIIAEVTDFAAVSAALNEGKAVVSYDLTTKAWDVQVDVTEEDYITGNLMAGEETTRTVEIVFVDNDKYDEEDSVKVLADLFAELDAVVDIKEAKLDGGFEYYQGQGFDYYANANLDVTVDLSNNQYVAVMGIIMAYGMEDNTAMKAAVESYMAAGGTVAIVEQLEALTSAQIITSMKAARGVSFADMYAALGITATDEAKVKVESLEALYDDALQLGYLLVTKLGFTGGGRKLGSLNNGEFATYEVTKANWNGFKNLHLKLILADEEYSIIFRDWDDSIISAESCDLGSTIVPPADPTREVGKDENLSKYVFAGWTPEVPATVTGNAEFKATYEAYVEVTFLDANGEEISVTEYKVGDAITAPTAPEKAATAKYTYTFVGWKDKATGTIYTNGIPAASENVTYAPAYSKTKNTYTVTWKNYDGTILEVDENVEYGTEPTYDGAKPTKASTAKYKYTFKGWTPAISEVTGDVTYTAKYSSSVRTYTITWVNENGKVLETDKNVKYGTMPSYDGKTPTKKSTLRYKYTFNGWDPEVEKVTGNATYTATYTKTKISSEEEKVTKYTIIFKDYDGTIISKKVYEKGEKIKVPADPTRKADSKYTYTFKGWSPKVVKTAKADATYTATYTKKAIKPIHVTVKDVEISSANVSTKGAIYGCHVDEDNKLIYLDVSTDGITHTEFNKYVEFDIDNADKVTKTFSDKTNKLVQTGEKIKISASNKKSSKSVSYTIIVLGDVVLDGGVGDGRIRANDASVILKHCVGKVTLKGNAARAAKINNTNGIDAGDATIVLKKSVGNPKYKTWLDK